jgi:hypothetical protein
LNEHLSESRLLPILTRWAPVVVGAVVALLMFRLINFIVPEFRASVAYESRGEITVLTPERQMLADALQLFVTVLSLSLAHFLGGLVAGRMTSSSPGLKGALTVVLTAVFGVIWFLIPVLPVVIGTLADPQIRSEDAGLYFVWVIIFAVIFPVILLAGYLGGKLGGRFRPATRP